MYTGGGRPSPHLGITDDMDGTSFGHERPMATLQHAELNDPII